MRIALFLLLGCWIGSASGCGRITATAEARHGKIITSTNENGIWEVRAKTQPLPGRIAQIAPAVLHPVEKVYVVPGERVKKDDKLVEIDADEPKADVRAREATLKEMQASLERLKREPRQSEQNEARANLESARITRATAENLFQRLRPLWKSGAVAEQRYHEAVANRKRSVADEHAADARLDRLRKRPFEWELNEWKARINTARANLDAAKAELEHYTVMAPISGVVSWLDVHLGTVSRPGTSLWGEILDLRQIDVRCELTPQQADRLVKGQSAEVVVGKSTFPAKVAMIGIAADQHTGRIPVLVRVKSANERIRCYVPVTVRFGGIE
jgi:multidrug resistance efflux pump